MGNKVPDDVYQRTIQVLRDASGPLSASELGAQLELPADQVLAVCQQLIEDSAAKIQTVSGSGELHLELNTERELAEQKRLKGLEPDERLVYQIIEQTTTTGIWIRDIRTQSNLQNPRLQKVLKALEGRQLIKTVKIHTHSSKKMYMLYNLSPSEELTGGAWYTDGNLDEQLVDTMRQFCVRVIEQKGEMSLDAITSLVRAKFTQEQNLSSGHMRQILQTLMFDGLIDEHDGEDGEPIYVNLIMKLPSTSPLSSIPCGQCPVLHECAEGNDISPTTCEYMNAWLDF